MNIRFFALTVPVLSLAACAVPEAYDGGGRGHMPPVQNQAGTDDFRAFSCENGLSVRVRHLDSGKVALRLDGRRAVLSSDVAASGERYTAEHGLFGNATEWHQKGGEAFSALPMPTAIRSKLPAAPVKRGSLFEPPSGFFGRFFVSDLFWLSAGFGGFRAWRIIFRFVPGLSYRQRLNANFKPAPISSGLLSNDKI